jgi:oxygen-independent coproporphyrinogen III oxidase
MAQMGLYLHFPFCVAKCLYCDFNSRVGSEAERSAYLACLKRELRRCGGVPVATVYFGGGTPTVYGPEALAGVLDEIAGEVDLPSDAEVTLEANPGTVSPEGLRLLRGAGFNRLSLGLQSLSDGELRLLGRIHTADEGRRAVGAAREAGFSNVSVDLMRGLPGQRFRGWMANLEAALALAPDHVSVYGLTLEDGTALAAMVAAGEVSPPAGSGDGRWVSRTVRRLRDAGLVRYEVSNYALQGCESRHNLNYWHNGDYLGLGAGAWGYADGRRSRNVCGIEEYIWAVDSGAALTHESECLSPVASLGETMMLGLRLVGGVSRRGLSERYGLDITSVFSDALARLGRAGLTVVEGDQVRATERGMLVLNAVAAEFLA